MNKTIEDSWEKYVSWEAVQLNLLFEPPFLLSEVWKVLLPTTSTYAFFTTSFYSMNM